MSDLIAELRRVSKELGEQPRGVAWGYGLLMSQAADEIERLQGLAGAVTDGPSLADLKKPHG